MVSDVNETFDVLFSVQHPTIFDREILERQISLNLHNAPLPEYRGFNTISHAILNGDTTYGSTVHWMEEEVDCGPILRSVSYPIAQTEIAETLYKKSIAFCVAIFRSVLIDLQYERELPKIPQVGTPHFYRRHDLDSHREISDIHDENEVDIKARAFCISPHEPTYYMVGNKKYYIHPA